MKLNFPILDEPITLEKSTILVLEDVQVFAQMVRNLYQYCLLYTSDAADEL